MKTASTRWSWPIMPSPTSDCDENQVDYPSDAGKRSIEDHITSWEHRYEFRTGKFAQTDYNFKPPSTSLMTNEPTVMELPGVDKYEYYEYPGSYREVADGSSMARVRMEEVEVEHDVVEGTSLCKTFAPGGKFTLSQHRCATEEGNAFVITSVTHHATEPLGYETGSAAANFEYKNEFKCIPDSVTFRPPRLTPKPRVDGVQTAVVVGPSGETIYPDEFGRVKVQFHWDREGKKDENSSCWIRVSFPWAGQQWGGMSLPHVGQEVITSFENGDIDRPIVVGRVYNAEQMPPLELPSEKDWTINRDHYGNEINMKADVGTISLICPTHESELHLGKSIEFTTLSDLKGYVENCWDTLTMGDRSDEIVGQMKMKIGADLFETFLGCQHKTLVGLKSTFIGGLKRETIVGAEHKKINGIKHETINGAVVKKGNSKELKTYPDAAKHVKAMAKEKAGEMYNEAATMIKNKCTDFKIGAELFAQDIDDIIINVENGIKETASDVSLKAKVGYKMTTNDLKMKAAKAAFVMIMNVNRGNFTVKK